jgi:hypothetical protein
MRFVRVLGKTRFVRVLGKSADLGMGSDRVFFKSMPIFVEFQFFEEKLEEHFI